MTDRLNKIEKLHKRLLNIEGDDPMTPHDGAKLIVNACLSGKMTLQEQDAVAEAIAEWCSDWGDLTYAHGFDDATKGSD